MSNFAFLQPEWALIFEAAGKAEGAANSDARTSCFYARRSLELAVAWLYKHDKSLRLPYQDNLSALIHEPTFRETVGDALFTKARLIKELGNLAVHSTKKMASSDALSATRELFHFCYWLARTYGRTSRPAPGLRFDVNLLPAAPSSVQQAPSQTLEQLTERYGPPSLVIEELKKNLSSRIPCGHSMYLLEVTRETVDSCTPISSAMSRRA